MSSTPYKRKEQIGDATLIEGMRPVIIEREEEYQADIRRRLKLVMAGPEEKARAIIEARGELETPDDLPLFGAVE